LSDDFMDNPCVLEKMLAEPFFWPESLFSPYWFCFRQC